MALPPDDSLLHASISGLWNAAYSIGWAAGPLLGGTLYDLLQEHALCTGDVALPPYCPDHGTTEHHSTDDGGGTSTSTAREIVIGATDATDEAGVVSDLAMTNCSCTWQPRNGFDGFGTVVALVSYGFALVLLLAAAFNVTGRPPTRAAPGGGGLARAVSTTDMVMQNLVEDDKLSDKLDGGVGSEDGGFRPGSMRPISTRSDERM